MKCSECNHLRFTRYNGRPSRYSCEHPELSGYQKICNCKRGNDELVVKTAPKWCPLNNIATT